MVREYPLEEDMATLPSIYAWTIPWTEEFGRLQSLRVGHDWSDLACTLTSSKNPLPWPVGWTPSEEERLTWSPKRLEDSFFHLKSTGKSGVEAHVSSIRTKLTWKSQVFITPIWRASVRAWDTKAPSLIPAAAVGPGGGWLPSAVLSTQKTEPHGLAPASPGLSHLISHFFLSSPLL